MPILGHGDIASVLEDREGFLFFVSGVSNSQETDEAEYEREIKLLLQQDIGLHIVYVSTLAVFYSDTRYTQHKLQVERIIKRRFPKYTIVRIGNITWGTNPHTLINYLHAHPEAEIRDEYRYIVTRDEFLHWISLIPEWSCEMNITGKRMKVREIVDEYVRLYTK